MQIKLFPGVGFVVKFWRIQNDAFRAARLRAFAVVIFRNG